MCIFYKIDKESNAAIIVDKCGREVDIIFGEEESNREFRYCDWMDLNDLPRRTENAISDILLDNKEK